MLLISLPWVHYPSVLLGAPCIYFKNQISGCHHRKVSPLEYQHSHSLVLCAASGTCLELILPHHWGTWSVPVKRAFPLVMGRKKSFLKTQQLWLWGLFPVPPISMGSFFVEEHERPKPILSYKTQTLMVVEGVAKRNWTSSHTHLHPTYTTKITNPQTITSLQNLSIPGRRGEWIRQGE